jgi:K(+)-stimulated pyrophosphate-energized sodium pump
MNILIKLMSIVSLVVAPTLAQLHESEVKTTEQKVEKNIQISIQSNDTTQSEISVKEGPDQGLISALKADGLVGEGSTSIQYENGVLKVNGKEVDAEKYKQYLKGDKMEIKITEEKH